MLLHSLAHDLPILDVVAVEPETAKAAKHVGLDEAHPAALQLHDDAERAVAVQDAVVDHRAVVGDPYAVGRRDGRRPMELDDRAPRHEEGPAHGLRQAHLNLLAELARTHDRLEQQDAQDAEAVADHGRQQPQREQHQVPEQHSKAPDGQQVEVEVPGLRRPHSETAHERVIDHCRCAIRQHVGDVEHVNQEVRIRGRALEPLRLHRLERLLHGDRIGPLREGLHVGQRRAGWRHAAHPAPAPAPVASASEA
mmetsp:Transcript_32388/g.96710  ORF Transcript_32388/g.96710 Transcript_32388/m.96710 type:complete len:252 (-) Transcript_32388:28-783(-)